MAFRLRSDESVAHGLRRLARNELEAVRGELRKTRPPKDEPVHEARKSVKKIRAILQLIDDDAGTGLGRSDKRLRSINRTLSELRDADVMMETLEKLRAKHPHVLSPHGLARARRRLSAQKRAVTRTVGGPKKWKAIDRTLQTVRRDAKGWHPEDRGVDVLIDGVRAAHRRGRQAMKLAEKQQRAEDFHAWRKDIKALWYALRVVEQSDANVRRDIRALHRAETLLGDDHNLVVLCEELSRDSTICRGPVDIDRLRLAADRDQCRLRAQAIARAGYIYRRRSGPYSRRVGRAWQQWCR